MSDSHDVENAPQTAPPTTGRADSSDDVLDIIADVEGRLERLRRVSRESGAVVDSMHQKQAELDKRLAELDTREGELASAAAALKQRAEEIDKQERHAESLCELADTERREIEQLKQGIEEDRRALAQERETLSEQQAAVKQEREQLASEQEQLRSRMETLEQDRAQLKQQLEQLDEQRTQCEAEHRAAMQAVDQKMDEIQAQRDERSEALQSQLEEARKQVAALKEHLEVQRAEAGKTEKSHAAELEQAALRTDSLQADLDAAQTRANELQAALDKTKGELQSRHKQLEATKAKLIQLGEALDGQAEQIQAGTEALAALESRDRRIAELESQLASSSAGGGESIGVDPSELTARDERIRSLEQQIAGLEEQVQAAAQNATSSVQGTAEEIAVRDQRISALEQEIASLEAQVQAARTASTSTESADEEVAKRDQAIEELSNHIRSLQSALKQAQAETAQRVKEINQLTESLEELQTRPQGEPGGSSHTAMDDEFAMRRRQRLQRMRQAIRDRSKRLNKARDVVKQQAHVVREIEEDKRTLADVRRNLEQAEQRMIRRWARSNTVTNLFLMVLTLSILGGASYFGVMTFWPTAYTARATIEAKGKPGFPLTDTQTNMWQTVHEEMLLSDTVINGIAQRMEQRGYSDLSDPAKLKAFLQEHLVTGSTAPGSINLELTTFGRDEAQRLLETYTIGLVSASNAERGRRTDGATSNLSVPVAVDPIPAKDNRVQIAGIAFGSSVAGLLLLGLPVYLKLRRSSSVFADEDLDGPMMDTQRWGEISNGAQNAEHVIS